MTPKKILITDDEPHVIRILRLMLEREGYLVETANDGYESLEKMAGFAPDVLISDIQMEGMDGRELCRTARQRYPQRVFLILVMTSMTGMDERSWVRELPNIEFLEKPLSPRQLVARLATYFASLPPATQSTGETSHAS